MQKITCRSFYVLIVLCAVQTLCAQDTTFMYQGRLNDGGGPANGNYDLRFQIYDAVTNGNAIGFPLTNSAIAVSNGLFATTLDFGAIFTGTNYWLQISVQTNGLTNTFTSLVPRQPILPTPYAVFANTASNLLGTLAATQLSGTLPSSAFAGYTNTVSLTNNANLFSGTFAGNGTNLVNLNASQLTGGTVTDARLSSNVPLLNANQTFSGANNLTNWGNNFVGSFFGNGLVGWIPTNGTSIQAVIDHGYLLENSQLVMVTLPVSANVGDIVRISGAGARGWQIAQNGNQSILGNFSSFSNSSWVPADVAARNWTSIASSADGSHLVAVAAAVTTGTGGIYTSTDSGATWSGPNGDSSSPWCSVASSADGARLVAAIGSSSGIGGIYTNSGTSWGKALAGSVNWSSVASSADGSKLMAAISNSTSGGIYTSANSGATWSQTVGTARNWVAVASSADGSKLAAAVYGGGIYTSANWSQATSAGSKNWTSIASSADGSRLAAAVSGGVIYTSSDSGSSWVADNVPTANWSSIASSADGSKLAAVANGGGIYLSSNGGATWTQANPTNGAAWSCIASSADGSKLAATVLGGGIYHSQTSLQSVTTTGTSGYINGIQGSAVELQYIGNNQWMPVSSAGMIWAH